MLELKRQVLKRRVKRDFLELAGPAPGQQPARPAPMQLLRPAPGRPAHHQYTRPANQLPGGLVAAQRRPGVSPPTAGRHHQQPGAGEALEPASSGPGALFAPPAPYKQRPPAPPLADAGPGPLSHHAQAHNSTLRPAPFTDPSWPLMWYLVSVCKLFPAGGRAPICVPPPTWWARGRARV